MKSLYTLIIGVLLLSANTALAQEALMAETNDINDVPTINEDDLPMVGVRYYYYPNLDAYFDTHENLYVYQQNGHWAKAAQIPSGYRGYSLYNNTRFEITDYNGDQPYTKLSEHRKQFPKKYSSRRMPPSKNIQSDSKVAYN